MKFFGPFALSVLFLLGGCSLGGNATGSIPRPVPVTRFYLLDGGVVTTPELHGRTVVVGFWASNCSHSSSGISDLNQLAWKYRNRKDIAFLAASIDKQENLEHVKEKISARDWSSVQHAFSGNDIYDEAWLSFKGDRVPYFFLVNPSGSIVAEGSDVDDIEKELGVVRR